MTVFLSKDHNEDVYSFNVGSIAIHEMIDLIGALAKLRHSQNRFVKKDLINFCRYSRNYIRSKARKICQL